MTIPDIMRSILSTFRLTDVLDVAIVAVATYKILGFIRETRAEQLAKGILMVLIAKFLADNFELYTVNWILGYLIDMGTIALVIIFQPELRRGLEFIGRNKFIPKKNGKIDKNSARVMISTLVETVDNFSGSKVGALIIIEREALLTDIAETGTYLNADISPELMGNIFYEGAPLHDGAAIIRNQRILAAGCVLPLTQNKNLSKELGTRHRAGIGITENSDAIAVIVSEETGIISIAVDGRLSRFLDLKSVEKTLLKLYLTPVDAQSRSLKQNIGSFFRKGGGNE